MGISIMNNNVMPFMKIDQQFKNISNFLFRDGEICEQKTTLKQYIHDITHVYDALDNIHEITLVFYNNTPQSLIENDLKLIKSLTPDYSFIYKFCNEVV